MSVHPSIDGRGPSATKETMLKNPTKTRVKDQKKTPVKDFGKRASSSKKRPLHKDIGRKPQDATLAGNNTPLAEQVNKIIPRLVGNIIYDSRRARCLGFAGTIEIDNNHFLDRTQTIAFLLNLFCGLNKMSNLKKDVLFLICTDSLNYL